VGPAFATDEFIRRFLIHVLPAGFHRIRHYGLFADHVRVKQLQRLRQLLSDAGVDAPETDTVDDHPTTSTYTCQACGAPMIIIDTFEKQIPRAPLASTLSTLYTHRIFIAGFATAAPVYCAK
jgi:hypothetical protein